MPSEEKISLQPIGYVTSVKGNVSTIVLRDDLVDALDGVQEFSHLFILFWMNKITKKERRTMKVHPRGRRDMPLLGIFATRTPYRPNPIGLTLVQLLVTEDNVLTVQGLDAFEGTPILDVKPFDNWDMVNDVRVPEWWMKLEKERTQKTIG